MQTDEKHLHRLFTYGTLQQEAVQLSTFGRKLAGQTDTLVGYRLVMVRIEDEDFVRESGTADHRNVQFTGDPSDAVEGIVFDVTQSELEQSDAYEPSGYRRTLVQMQSGLNAWVYLQQPELPAEDRY
jgi:gamma-glutamyl AIG2-like cyclotransferase